MEKADPQTRCWSHVGKVPGVKSELVRWKQVGGWIFNLMMAALKAVSGMRFLGWVSPH